MERPLLIGSLGCGSAVVELGFALAGLPVTVEDIPYRQPGPARERLLALNPLGQVPTLRLGDGTVLTESAATLLHLHDQAPGAGLLPAAGAPGRAAALDLLMLLAASLYPTFSYGDHPEEWTGTGPAAERLRDGAGRRRMALWRRIERRVAGPFLLGAGPSAPDLYVAVMTWWSPGPDWFRRETPRLAAAAEATRSLPRLEPVCHRHRPGPPAGGG